MLQRVGIAQAILHDPKVVFFDEPMSGLDPMGRREVRDLMAQLKHEGKTVFFSTHILSDAEALCDRVAIIHQGELRGVGAVADLTSSVHGKVELVWQGTDGAGIVAGPGSGVPCHRRHGAGHAFRSQPGRRHRGPAAGATAAGFRDPGADFAGRLLPAEIAAGQRRRGRGSKSMKSRIAHIASNTFREAVRDRVLYNLIVFALLMSGAAVLVGQISIDIERLVVINLGLTAVSLFGMVIAIFIGIGLVSKEIEKRTLYTVLSRPVRRWEFIVGKFFGLAGTLAVNTFFMAIGVFVALLYVSHHFQKQDGWVLVALVFHHSAISDHHRADLVLFLVLVAAAFGGVCVFAVCDWQLCRRPARICRHDPWRHALAGYGRSLPGAEFLGPECHHRRWPTPSRSRDNSFFTTAPTRWFTPPWPSARRGAGLRAPEPQMSGSRRVTVIFSVLLLGALAGSVLLLRRVDQVRTGATLEEVLYISSPQALKRLSLGYDGLLADIYWTRAVQYYGSKHHDGARQL